MRKFIAALAAGLALSASAQEMLATQGGDSIRLQQGPCSEGVLRHLEQGTRGYFRKALVVYEGKEYVACWAVRGDGMVVLRYSDGDGGLVPVTMFSPVPDA
jgi:hypothetical protein